MPSDDSAATRRETRAPLVDAVETLAFVAVPAAGLAAVTAVSGRGAVAGLLLGAVLGAVFAAFRRTVVAVRTPDGIERRLRRFDDDPETNPWVRLANVEYDKKYEPVVAAGSGVVGVAALAAVVLFADDPWIAVRLLAVGLVGLVGALGALGMYYVR